jgi:hypothetical protein
MEAVTHKIQIKFDGRTRLRDMQPLMIAYPELISGAREKVTEGIDPRVFDFFGMTVAEFLQLQENVLPQKVEKHLKKRKATFYDYLKIQNTFDIGAMSLEKILTDTIIPSDSKDEMARVGLIDLTTEEAMLTFLRDYFNLSGLEQAQGLSLYEYVTARKVTFNNAKFQKNLANINKSKA